MEVKRTHIRSRQILDLGNRQICGFVCVSNKQSSFHWKINRSSSKEENKVVAQIFGYDKQEAEANALLFSKATRMLEILEACKSVSSKWVRKILGD